MKKSILVSLLMIMTAVAAFSQAAANTAMHTPAPAQFTKAELLAFNDLKALLSAINKKDYSAYLVRNFNLTTTITNADKTTTKLSESGPGGTWSERQKAMIEKYAKKGTAFTLESIILVKPGKKGTSPQPNTSFSIK